jgi:aminopeptidase N
MFEWTKKGIEYYENLFNLPFPFRKYDQVFCPEFIMGAMEGAGCVCFNDSYVWKETPVKSEVSRFCCTLMHELSHMWFGNMVTLKWWDDLWLNEAFATYISFRAMHEALEWDNWMEFTLRKELGFSADRLNSHPIKVAVPDTHEAFQNLDEITYDKGSAIIQQLVSEVGKEEFFKGISNYLNKHAWVNVTSTDLYESFQVQISGLSTSDWMDQWVNKLGLNSLGLVKNDNQYFISQGIVSGSTLRRSLITVRHYTFDLDYLQEFKLEILDQELSPCPTLTDLTGIFLLNPRNECFFDIYLPDFWLNSIFHKQNLYKLSQLERASCWKQLWAMVENNRLPADSFLNYVAELLQYESEEELIDYLHNFSLKAIFNYLPYELISEASSKMISNFRSLLDSSFRSSKNLRNK